MWDQHTEDVRAKQVQTALLREATVARRFGLARSLTRSVLEMTRRSLRQQHPEADDETLIVLFVERLYGSDLARGLQAHLRKRRHGRT